jgi:hypothetical protein
MTNHTSILVDNFKESLKGAQTYLVVGNVTALFLLMLALQGHLVDGASEEKLDIPFLGLKAPSFFAAAVAFPLYVFSGIAAHAFLTRSRRIRDRLADIDSTLLYSCRFDLPDTAQRWPGCSDRSYASTGIGLFLRAIYFKGE